jgi:hypothetical protein
VVFVLPARRTQVFVFLGRHGNNRATMLRPSVDTRWFGTLLLALTVSCAGNDDKPEFTDEDAQALCREVVDVACEKLYECLSDAELALIGYTGTVAACKTQGRDEAGCDAFTAEKGNCEGSEVFKKDKADDCVRQLSEASCNQVSSDDEFAPACDQTCKVE